MAENDEGPSVPVESSGKKRPNANYKLSNQRTELTAEEELKFHYSRERRLEKAPPSVRRLYEEPSKKNRFSLIRPLIADKPRATIFFTIIFMMAIIFIMSIIGQFGSSYKLDGNKLEINAVAIEDVTLIIIKKTIDNNEPFFGEVNIGVSPVSQDEDFPVFLHKIFFSLQEEERYSFTVPFNDPKLVMVFETEKSKQLKVTIKPE